MVDFLIQLDQELLVYLNNLGQKHWDGFWLFMTNKYTSVPLYLVLIILFAKKRTTIEVIIFIVLGILTVTFSDQLANLFKFGFKRLRPCHEQSIANLVRLVKQSCGGKFSYFSAHASTAMALAIYFGVSLRTVFSRLKYILIVFAFLVGYSRIYIGVHYPLDVITGFTIGAIIGFLMYTLFHYIVRNRKSHSSIR